MAAWRFQFSTVFYKYFVEKAQDRYNKSFQLLEIFCLTL